MRNLIAVALLALATPAGAAVMSEALHGVAPGQSIEDVRAAIEPHAAGMKLVEVEAPVIPVAESAEAHLIVTGLEAANGTKLGSAAFVFGDGALAYVELRGNVRAAVETYVTGELGTFMHFEASMQDMLVIDTSADAGWLLTPETAHPHMFMWSNPHLDEGESKSYAASVARPSVLEFGAALEDVKKAMESACVLSQVQEIEKVWLPNEPERQTQINCYGHEYGGFPRKIEAVFGDGILELAWILTGKGEEDRLRKALIAEFGEPEFVSEDMEAFAGWRVALRKDKPEVLMISEKLVPAYKAHFGGE